MAFNDKEKAQIKAHFLKEYDKTKTVSTAISGLPIHRKTLYNWFRDDPDFKQEFDDAKLAIGESLESKAFTLIDKMIEKGDYGKPVLLITMLNAHLPERYRQQENAGEDSRQLISEFRRMAKGKKAKKPKVVKEAEDIINDSDSK
tara:strand:- start:80 stop:514 length:435 start_codon:yes stop_codon:yes gene_type:complete